MSDLLWRLHPNGKRLAGVSITAEAFERIRGRGWLSVNGRRADVQALEAHEDGDRVRLRIFFHEDYPDAHP